MRSRPAPWLIVLVASIDPIPAVAADDSVTGRTPTYRIYPLRNGSCEIAGNHAFHEGDNAETYEYALYLWLILGGEKPILVDAGLTEVEEMNRGAAHVLRNPITQDSSEHSRVQLAKFGLTPEDIGHVLITHLHADHYDYFNAFPNAHLVVNRREYEANQGHISPDVRKAPDDRSDALMLVEHSEVVTIDAW